MNRRSDVSTDDDLPVVCTVTPETIATRKAGLLPGLARSALTIEEVGEGIRLSFSPDAISAVAATIDAERRCCRFLRFHITVEPDEGPVLLTLTGPPGTREFLTALIEL